MLHHMRPRSISPDRVKEARERAGLTQVEATEEAKRKGWSISRSQIIRIESGETTNPRIETLNCFADIYGLDSVDWMRYQ